MGDAAGGVRDLACGVLLAGSFMLALPGAERVPGAPRFWGAAGVVLGLAGAVYLEPLAAPRALGAIAVVFVGATALLLAIHLAGTVGDRRSLRRVPERFRKRIDGTRRFLPEGVPVLTIVIVWIFAAPFAAHDTVHQARTVTSATPAGRLDRELDAWLDSAWRKARASSPQRTDIPMLLVAASGGGAKAAYWIDLVLDCLFGSGLPAGATGAAASDAAGRECLPDPAGPERYGTLFLTSSVSGGSVGIHHFIR